MASSRAGIVARRSPMPAATARAITPNPSDVPTTCEPVRRGPNWAPDAHRSTLFGPGVTELTKAKPTSAASWSIAPPCIPTFSTWLTGPYEGPLPHVLYDPAVGASTRGTVRAWRPPIQGVREVLHASFREHAYPPHTHD